MEIVIDVSGSIVNGNLAEALQLLLQYVAGNTCIDYGVCVVLGEDVCYRLFKA